MGIFVAEIQGRGIAAYGDVSKVDADDWFGSEEFREGLMVLENEGKPLWNGEDEIYLRDAFPEEADRWRAAHAVGLRAGEYEEGEGMVRFLIPVTDPIDEDLKEEIN